MNPIIETIDAGHWSHGTKCALCKVDWPCPDILQARVHNRSYVPIPDAPPLVPPSPEVRRYHPPA